MSARSAADGAGSVSHGNNNSSNSVCVNGRARGDCINGAATEADDKPPGMPRGARGGLDEGPCCCQQVMADHGPKVDHSATLGAFLGPALRGRGPESARARIEDGRWSSLEGEPSAQPGTMLLLHVHLLGSEDAFMPVLELAQAPRAPAAVPPLKAGAAAARQPPPISSLPLSSRQADLRPPLVSAATAAAASAEGEKAASECDRSPLGCHDAAARQLYRQMAVQAGPSVETEPSIVLVRELGWDYLL